MIALAFALLAATAAPAQTRAPAQGAKIVLVAFTGPEDMMRLRAPYHHAMIMKREGADVAIVVYARAVAGLSMRGKTPPMIRKEQKAALHAGIPVFACKASMKRAGITIADLLPGVTPVESGAGKIAALVAQGYVPMQY